MIRSTVAKVVSLLVSAVVVAGAAQLAVPRETIQIEGGGPAVEARMGSRFEDMAVGTLTALSAEKILTPLAQITQVAPVLEIAEAQPVPALTTAPLSAETATLTALKPEPAAVATLLPAPTQAQRPTPEAIITAEPDSDAPILSRRPTPKNAARAAEVAKAREQARAERMKKQAAASKTPRGNAKRSNVKGAENGAKQNAKPTQSGKTRKAAPKAGSAAVSNYPGQVMRRISRVGKPRVRAKGTAVIAFSVSSSGGLSGMSVSRSSGSAGLDRAAVAMVRKAAPFPRPPVGAQRNFSIRIKGQ